MHTQKPPTIRSAVADSAPTGIASAVVDESGDARPDGLALRSSIDSPIGTIVLVASKTALLVCEFADPERLAESLARAAAGRAVQSASTGESVVLDRTAAQLSEYFRGTRRIFDLPLELPAGEFSQRVWRALAQIPFGQTRSYSEQARAIGVPQSVRAVANANGRNPLAIIIPCHRVIGADGSLTGYGGGLERKRWLLEHERRQSGESLF